MSSPVEEVRFVALGDVRGRFRDASKRIREGVRMLGGRADLVLCTGDVEANRDSRDAAGVTSSADHRRWVGEFPLLLRGGIRLAAPMWFVGGDHEPWATLDSTGPGPVGSSVNFLGRAGVREVGGLRVAFLSGVAGDATSLGIADRHGRDERACYVLAELAVLSRAAAGAGSIDVLLTHDWPLGVFDGRGDERVAALSGQVQASLHLCGHHRERRSGALEKTAVEALGPVERNDGVAAFVRRSDGSIEQVG